ncbi:hypothetical protein ABGB14_36910 [Nonomuraea sp. B10E15]
MDSILSRDQVSTEAGAIQSPTEPRIWFTYGIPTLALCLPE